MPLIVNINMKSEQLAALQEVRESSYKEYKALDKEESR